MYLDKKEFNNDVMAWKNKLKTRKFVTDNTVKGNVIDLISIVKILLRSIKSN